MNTDYRWCRRPPTWRGGSMTCCGGPGSFNRTPKKSWTCFDRLSTNGNCSAISTPDPFALSLSKGERGVLQPAKEQVRGACETEVNSMERPDGAFSRSWPAGYHR